MSEGCIFEHEGMCVGRNEELGVSIPLNSCRFDKEGECAATEEDLVELCEFCLQPNCEEECLEV